MINEMNSVINNSAIAEVEFVEFYKECTLVGTFNNSGFRVGYVGIPTRNKYYGKSCDDLPKIDGIVSEVSTAGNDEWHSPIINKYGLWWFGFSAMSGGFDIEKAKSMFTNVPSFVNEFCAFKADQPVITEDQILDSCKKIADALHKYMEDEDEAFIKERRKENEREKV